ncbi:MAG: alpha/beta fold hydrolase, partial [Clostridia bacterium]|nr:alpha/beta fold hydrolase [Clostridia bacterium]
DEFIAAFLGEHPEEMEGVWAFSPEMEAALSQYGGIGGLAKQFASLGAPVKIDPAYEGEIQGYKVFYVPVVFPAMSADLLLAVQDGVIAGIQSGAYSGGKEETPAESDAFDSIELALPVPGLGELPGTLTLPKGEGPFPAVVLIHGSGPNDRDETAGNQKPFRDIAEGLAAKGIAVYRFDKRSYVFGLALAADKTITLETESVEDAVNAVQLLAAQDRIDPERILVLGHSLGGNAVPAIARALKEAPVKACGFIMMAASPRPLDELVREQYDFLYSLMPEVTEELQAQKDAVFADLDRLQDVDALAEDDTVMDVWSSYWKWLAHYDILEAAEEIEQPVLLLQGEEDYQVTMVDFGIWQEHFGTKENWQLKSYPGLTHLFTAGLKTEGGDAYMKDEKMDARVISDVAEFVNGIR